MAFNQSGKGMTAWEYMIDLHKSCFFMSKERPGRATNSELKRWCQNKAVLINGKRVNYDDEITFPINQLVLFPNSSKKRITIF